LFGVPTRFRVDSTRRRVRNPFDVIIIGGGLVGLALARALTGSGLRLALIEPQPPAPPPVDTAWDSRIFALSPGSAAFLAAGGAWERLPRARIARVEAMRIFGDDPGARLDFNAYDAGLRELALIVENRRLLHALREAAREQDLRVYCPAGWTALEIHDDHVAVRLDDGRRYLVNVGSVGQPRDRDPRACYAIWDREARFVTIRRVAYDHAGAAAKILAAGLPRALADRLAHGS